jgi:hypothetical protein
VKIYVAAPFPRAFDLVRPMMTKLRRAGHTITYDWTAGIGDPTYVRKAEVELPLAEQQKFANQDLEGIRSADLVWGLATESGGTGMWFELGIAEGLRRHREDLAPRALDVVRPTIRPEIVVSGPPRTIFTSLFEKRFADHDDALAYILTL